jgi:hypothetical protein
MPNHAKRTRSSGQEDLRIVRVLTLQPLSDWSMSSLHGAAQCTQTGPFLRALVKPSAVVVQVISSQAALALGVAVVDAVGVAVGRAVVALEGERDGTSVGVVVGVIRGVDVDTCVDVGEAVYKAVGDGVGSGVGACVKACVGEAVGDSVGSGVGLNANSQTPHTQMRLDACRELAS